MKSEIREVTPGDLPDLVRFYASQDPEDHSERGDPESHLRWFLFENPESGGGAPTGGFLARGDDGRVTGALLAWPQRFRAGSSEHVVIPSGGYYVDPQHRGLGLLLLRRLLTACEGFACISTTMNQASGGIYERRGGYAIPRTDRELLGVLRWPPLVDELMLRRGISAPLRLAARLAALRPAAVRRGPQDRLRRVTSPDEIDDDALAPLPELGDRLTAVRSRAYLRWRYFDGHDATRALFVYRGERGTGLAGVYQRSRGQARQIRALVVLDLWGSLPPAETPALLAALCGHYAKSVHVVTLRGLLPEREACVLAAGFRSRPLPRPTGVCIDPAGVLPTRDWYLVPADGDTGH